MNKKPRKLSLATRSTREHLEYVLNSLACRQSRLACTPSEYKKIQDELNELKRIAHKIQSDNRIEGIGFRMNAGYCEYGFAIR
mgnify:CR=1 FL=1